MRERLNLEQILKQQALLGSEIDLSSEQLNLLIRRTITSEAHCARLEAAMREVIRFLKEDDSPNQALAAARAALEEKN